MMDPMRRGVLFTYPRPLGKERKNITREFSLIFDFSFTSTFYFIILWADLTYMIIHGTWHIRNQKDDVSYAEHYLLNQPTCTCIVGLYDSHGKNNK